MAVTCALLTMSGCNDFLDTQNYVKKDTSNFPQNVDDANQLLTGVYGELNLLNADPDDAPFFISEVASDDRFASGGVNDNGAHGADKLLRYGVDQFANTWKKHYAGIYKANVALEGYEKVLDWESEAQKNSFYGQTYFLRAFYYFDLAQLFGEVPLILNSAGGNFPKSNADVIYAQIASDLKNGIEMMDATKYPDFEAGRATRWAAEALMARVFLFYTGYYGESSLPLLDGGEVTKAEVITWLEDCRDNSGHDLVGDFRNLWPYTNEYTIDDYPYVAGKIGVDGQPLKWAGDGNIETIFATKFSNVYALSAGYVNYYALYFAPPINVGESTFPWGRGWGKACVTPNLWDDWLAEEPTDLRRQASIIDVTDPNEMKNYTWGANSEMEETGYWQKKIIAVAAKDPSTGGFVNGFAVLASGARNHIQFCNTTDLIHIRYADVLLMHSELTQTTDGINKVRQRAGLPVISSYSLDALKRERRFELAFEGLRWFDLMRWGDAPDALEKQVGQPIRNAGVPLAMSSFSTGFKARYEATGGFWPIPDSQIDLSEGVLKQNKGWIEADAMFEGW
ncbi:RagB/SusD family nutrient uptake outer membrane protein [Bacteroides stercoris]|uniref:RagB/SusD family nutrient uptake outer membrane protein n=2 Tax=Bacteroides stercoris TaxID=46506 RepID=A0A412DH32_BACSE|nr:RagB/SusD family nutrient uptake outer membrane protein [Bacteroides stercoris]RGZ89220.1 RagB/SusD family nutrient uptake outer membrane protein [Bacteroides stercoris]